MPPLESSMIPLGTACPDFDLSDPRGFRMRRGDAEGRPLLVMFLCNHCPFVKHVRAELARIGREYLPKGVAIAAINANDPRAYPDDSPERMVEEACDAGYAFPYLFDATQEVARRFDAQCTPDYFLFDQEQRLVYRGQLDASRPGSETPVTGEDLRRALDAVLEKKGPIEPQHPSIGCSIKWRS